MADPLLEGKYPLKDLYQALAVAAICIQEEVDMRPIIGDVVTALEYLAKRDIDDKCVRDASMKTHQHLNCVKRGNVNGI